MTIVRRAAALIAVGALTLLVSCRASGPMGPAGEPLETWEAERAVFILDRDPAGSARLIQRIASDLQRLRDLYRSLPDMDAYRVRSPWAADELAVILDDNGRARLLSGDDWPEFEAVCARLDAVDWGWCGGRAILLLADKHNPCGLCGSFDGIEGIVGAEPVWHTFADEAASYLIWPQFTQDGMGYLFERREHNRSTYVFFRSDRYRSVRRVGAYDPGNDPEPVWWVGVHPPYFDYTCP